MPKPEGSGYRCGDPAGCACWPGRGAVWGGLSPSPCFQSGRQSSPRTEQSAQGSLDVSTDCLGAWVQKRPGFAALKLLGRGWGRARGLQGGVGGADTEKSLRGRGAWLQPHRAPECVLPSAAHRGKSRPVPGWPAPTLLAAAPPCSPVGGWGPRLLGAPKATLRKCWACAHESYSRCVCVFSWGHAGEGWGEAHILSLSCGGHRWPQVLKLRA